MNVCLWQLVDQISTAMNNQCPAQVVMRIYSSENTGKGQEF